jgi:hypothetical protein
MAFKALPVADAVAGTVVDSLRLGARLVGPVVNCGIPVAVRRSPIEKRSLHEH